MNALDVWGLIIIGSLAFTSHGLHKVIKLHFKALREELGLKKYDPEEEEETADKPVVRKVVTQPKPPTQPRRLSDRIMPL